MAQIIKRTRKDGSTSYLAQIAIKRNGAWWHRESRTFDTRAQAQAWHKRRMKEIEAAGDDLRRVKGKGRTVGDAIDRYLADHGDAIGKTKAQVLRTLRAEYDIADTPAQDVTSGDLVDLFRQIAARPDVGSASTVLNYASHLRAVFAVARTAYGIPLDRDAIADAMDAAKRLRMTAKSARRSRRPTLDELDTLLTAFERKAASRPNVCPMHRIVGFALFSTRRQEEITRITWDDLDQTPGRARVFIKDMKHPGDKVGNDVWCDLPDQALQIAQAMPRRNDDPRVFPFNTNTISAAFTRGCHAAEIEDLRFHDLRHEGVSRLFETGLSIPQVAAVSGHRSWSSLQRYTHLRQTGDKYAGWAWLDRLAA